LIAFQRYAMLLIATPIDAIGQYFSPQLAAATAAANIIAIIDCHY